jgi:ankyrin repeat protein
MVNARDNMLNTPMHFAAVMSKVEEAKMLIANGADISMKNRN